MMVEDQYDYHPQTQTQTQTPLPSTMVVPTKGTSTSTASASLVPISTSLPSSSISFCSPPPSTTASISTSTSTTGSRPGTSTKNSKRKSKKSTTKKSQQKLCNTSALLDQYQDDDDLTTNLLHAIRSWNLERPSTDMDSNSNSNRHSTTAAFAGASTPIAKNGSPFTITTPVSTFTTTPPNNIHKNGHEENQNHDCSSTINTISSDYDTTTSASSTITSTHYQRGGWNQNLHHTHNYNHGGGASSVMTNGTNGSLTVGSCNSSTMTNGSNATGTSCSSAVKKTPCRGNYSSRPSGLTARILLESEEFDNDEHDECSNDEHSNDEHSNDEHSNDEQDNDHKEALVESSEIVTGIVEQQCGSVPIHEQERHDTRNNNLHQHQRQQHPHEETKEPDNDPHRSTKSSLPHQNSTLPELKSKSENNNNQDSMNAMAILQETALTLGLQPNNDEFQKIIPTIKKLVRVVMVHVPNLERFVDEVCDIVMKDHNNHNNTTDDEEGLESGLESGLETDDCEEGKHEQEKMTMRRKRRSRRQRRKQSKKKNIQARKGKMDQAVHILKQEWQGKVDAPIMVTTASSAQSGPSGLSTPSPPVSKSLRSRRALQKVNVNSIDMRDSHDKSENSDNNHVVKSKTMTREGNDFTGEKTSTTQNQPESSFQIAVIEKLKKCQHFQHEAQETSFDDTEKALSMIENLVKFEQKYKKVHGRPESDNVSSEGILSPPQSNSILNDLFDTDTNTLRRFVLHFAYLFSVRQDEIMSKMNDIYVFSHEASTMITNMKKTLGLSPRCPIHSVARKVEEIVVSLNDASVTTQLPPEQSNLQQRNHHVRFNCVVEEFS